MKADILKQLDRSIEALEAIRDEITQAPCDFAGFHTLPWPFLGCALSLHRDWIDPTAEPDGLVDPKPIALALGTDWEPENAGRNWRGSLCAAGLEVVIFDADLSVPKNDPKKLVLA